MNGSYCIRCSLLPSSSLHIACIHIEFAIAFSPLPYSLPFIRRLSPFWSHTLTGQAYVTFASNSDLDEAIKRNQQWMGSRYINVFLSNSAELRNTKEQHRRHGADTHYEEDRAGLGYRHSHSSSRRHHSPSPSPHRRGQEHKREIRDSKESRENADSKESRESRENRENRPGPWVLRLRGVPFAANEDDIRRFLRDVVPGKMHEVLR